MRSSRVHLLLSGGSLKVQSFLPVVMFRPLFILFLTPNCAVDFILLCAAKVVTDRVSGRSKGFDFVRYATIEEAEKSAAGDERQVSGWMGHLR